MGHMMERFLDLMNHYIQKKLKLYASKPDSVNLFNKQITALNLDIVEYKESIIEAYPKSFISQLFLAMKSPDIEIMAKEDTVKAFQYLKKHYWD